MEYIHIGIYRRIGIVGIRIRDWGLGIRDL